MDCLVCRRPVPHPPGGGGTKTQRRSSILDSQCFEDQLVVIYFCQKFFESPLLVPFGGGDKEEVTPEVTPSLESLLTSLGNPSRWFDFCDVCTEIIRKNSKLHKQLSKLQFQMKVNREKIQDRVWLGHPGIRESGVKSREVIQEQLVTCLRKKIEESLAISQGIRYSCVLFFM